jgi:excisionase family DNA binding protein
VIVETRIYTVAEAAKALRISPRSYYAGFARGELPGVRVGRVIRVSATQLARWKANDRTGRDGLSDREGEGARGVVPPDGTAAVPHVAISARRPEAHDAGKVADAARRTPETSPGVLRSFRFLGGAHE